jgi:hypothetical protein
MALRVSTALARLLAQHSMMDATCATATVVGAAVAAGYRFTKERTTCAMCAAATAPRALIALARLLARQPMTLVMCATATVYHVATVWVGTPGTE